MAKQIRIRDIAKMAKVSVGTVDRVIHKRGEVAEESYKRVVAILEKNGIQAESYCTHPCVREASEDRCAATEPRAGRILGPIDSGNRTG